MFSWLHFFDGIKLVFGFWKPAKPVYCSSHNETILLNDWKIVAKEIKSAIDDNRNERSNTTKPRRQNKPAKQAETPSS